MYVTYNGLLISGEKKEWYLIHDKTWMSPGNIMPTVMTCSGRCNKIPLYGHLMNNRNFFLTVLEATSPRPWHMQVLCLVRARFLLDGRRVAVTSHGREVTILSGVSFRRTLILLTRFPLSSQGCPSKWHHLGDWDFNLWMGGKGHSVRGTKWNKPQKKNIA